MKSSIFQNSNENIYYLLAHFFSVAPSLIFIYVRNSKHKSVKIFRAEILTIFLLLFKKIYAS